MSFHRKAKISSRHAHLIEVMAKAMARRNGAVIDEMRPSTGNKWRYLAEAALAALAEEVADMQAALAPIDDATAAHALEAAD